MTRTVPVSSLWEGLEKIVLKPANALRPVTADGFADARALIAEAMEELRIGGAPQRRPPIFDETTFVHDGFWWPVSDLCDGTKQEVQILENLSFFVANVLQSSDFTVAGYKEPRGHDRSHSPIDPDWWNDHIKVDFRRGLLWARDRETDSWRLLYSDIMIWRPDWYVGVFDDAERGGRLQTPHQRKKPPNKGGRPPKWEWDGALQHARAFKYANSGATRADLHNAVMDWFAANNHGDGPADSEVRRRVGALWDNEYSEES